MSHPLISRSLEINDSNLCLKYISVGRQPDLMNVRIERLLKQVVFEEAYAGRCPKC